MISKRIHKADPSWFSTFADPVAQDVVPTADTCSA